MYPLQSHLHPSEGVPDVRIVPAREFRSVAWNNGGGTTRDIDVLADADAVVARVSLASIERDGPFSDFTGYDRTIVLVAGAGATLHFGGGTVVGLDRIAEPFGFDGGDAVVARVPGGPVQAFNVMTRRDQLRHRVTAGSLTSPFDPPSSVAVRYVLVVVGSVAVAGLSGTVEGGEVMAGDALRIIGPGSVACRAMTSNTVVIVADIERAG